MSTISRNNSSENSSRSCWKIQELVTRAARLTFIGKYYERIADHATNIAELVVYLVEGKIIRHAVAE